MLNTGLSRHRELALLIGALKPHPTGCTRTKQVATTAHWPHALGADHSQEQRRRSGRWASRILEEKHNKVACRWAVSCNTEQNLSNEIPRFLEENKKFSPRLSLEIELHQLDTNVVIAVIGFMGLLLCCGSFTSFFLLSSRNVRAVWSVKQHCPLWQTGSQLQCLASVGRDSQC